MYLIKNLNNPQREAVQHLDGPLLILAGPGSGKTRVITHRIAYLISQGIPANRILALTFTNKAAEEMKSRVENLVYNRCGSWISTFHSFCARILRNECSLLGYNSDFSIYDSDDQKRALKHVLDRLNIDTGSNLSRILGQIRNYKNQGITYENVPETKNYWLKKVTTVYEHYQEFLLKNNAFDFDDLILKTIEILHNYKSARQYYQEKFLYILIDEFQDTNIPQYKIAKYLTNASQNICATGDPDQSIYSWRGANIANILEFEKDFSNTKIIKLEQNYRSTKRILNVASDIISRNTLRKEKSLWTKNEHGETIDIVEAFDNSQEASWVCNQILKYKKKGYSLNDIVVFYRINSQSRSIETAMRNRDIPYGIVGGLEFYRRAEIKDIMAYLLVLNNERDDISLFRILNTPPRGIGEKTRKKIVLFAKENQIPVMAALRSEELRSTLSKRAQNKLNSFVKMIDDIKKKIPVTPLSKIVDELLKQSGYLDYIKNQDEKKGEDKNANVEEFIVSVEEYEKQFFEKSLTHFLQRISLFSNLREQSNNEKVTLMTLHSAKGLEFPIVFIVGASNGLLPHARSHKLEEIEEERRLLFVGITRAKKKLIISYSKISYHNGYQNSGNEPSYFLQEINHDNFNFVNCCKRSYYYDDF